MTLQETIDGLKYIADSPAPEYGGFHPNTVEIAKSALHYLTAEVRRREAAEKVLNLEREKEEIRMRDLVEAEKEWQSIVQQEGKS